MLDPLVLPGKFAKAGKLAYRVAELKNGWLTLAWDELARSPAPKAVSRSTQSVDTHSAPDSLSR